ncbi:MAG: hypothetical protein K2G32_01215, partial [Oscillospiraceae bacterium]|nr:hypothetical protein [Oscillospiraceae bacterium]
MTTLVIFGLCSELSGKTNKNAANTIYTARVTVNIEVLPFKNKRQSKYVSAAPIIDRSIFLI